jgi:hypothetical protein
MTSSAEDLKNRVAAMLKLSEHRTGLSPLQLHPRFKWEKGMIDVHGAAQVAVAAAIYFNGPAALDIDHPATKGVLLDQLRNATTPYARVELAANGKWYVFGAGQHYRKDGFDGEGEALEAALLSAWGSAPTPCDECGRESCGGNC